MKINTILDKYFQKRPIATKSELAVNVMQKIIDIEICREMNIPYANSLNELEISDYRFLSLFFQKEKFWKDKKQ